MAKLFVFLSLFIIFSCNKKDLKRTDPATVSALISYNPELLSNDDASKLARICNALDSKVAVLNDLGPDTHFTYLFSEKSCAAESASPALDILVKIEPSQDNYIFKKINNDAFAFPNVETTRYGSMAEICKNLGDIRSPMQINSSIAIWFTALTRTSECAGDNVNTLCVMIRKGQLVEGNDYRIGSEEWIKFQITGPRIGFFVERKLVSRSTCEIGKVLVRTATLK